MLLVEDRYRFSLPGVFVSLLPFVPTLTDSRHGYPLTSYSFKWDLMGARIFLAKIYLIQHKDIQATCWFIWKTFKTPVNEKLRCWHMNITDNSKVKTRKAEEKTATNRSREENIFLSMQHGDKNTCQEVQQIADHKCHRRLAGHTTISNDYILCLKICVLHIWKNAGYSYKTPNVCLE